jgi:hypothetical protein
LLCQCDLRKAGRDFHTMRPQYRVAKAPSDGANIQANKGEDQNKTTK